MEAKFCDGQWLYKIVMAKDGTSWSYCSRHVTEKVFKDITWLSVPSHIRSVLRRAISNKQQTVKSLEEKMCEAW